jgi:hypothetical protein
MAPRAISGWHTLDTKRKVANDPSPGVPVTHATDGREARVATSFVGDLLDSAR